MSREVVVDRRARLDLLRLNAFLAEKSERAADRAMGVIEAALRSLGDLPERAPEAGPGVRSLPIRFGRSGYVAWFIVGAERVRVLRVFHMREDRPAPPD